MIRAIRSRCMVALVLALVLPGAAGAGDTAPALDRLTLREADVVEAVGAVRYFHPHDAVTVVDWNHVLLEGRDEVLERAMEVFE